MSNPNPNPNPANPNPANPNPEPAKTVSHEEFEKLQTQKSELENTLNSFKTELEALKTEKLKNAENKDEYIKSLEAKIKESEDKFTSQKSQHETDLNKFKLSKVVSQFREVAAKEGVKHIDDLQKLYGDQLKNVKVNANFDVEGDTLKHIISSAKEKSPYLFGTPAPKVEDLNQTKVKQENYLEELKKCKTQKELDEVRKKFGRK